MDARSLDLLTWDHRFVVDLPPDHDLSNRRRQVEHAAFSRVLPTPTAQPTMLAWSPEVATMLGLSGSLATDPDAASVLGGSRVPQGADPFSMCYGGHQFGNWAGQLGDGRAIALGEVIDVEGRHQMLQLKGAGPTPYSRGADGRAVLRSSIREFLCSEAMFHLGVPTTRALSLVGTGDGVVRDMLYDGNPGIEPGAVVCRVAPTFTRFGNFQLPASRGDVELLRALTDFTIRTEYPHLSSLPFDERVVAFFAEVVDRTATLVVEWMRVGFVHGVLNTDNMSILGLTIDFGPYGWLEDYNPGWTPNTTDAGQRRYRFGAQPSIVGWNLAQLATALVPLLGGTAELQAALDTYGDLYSERFGSMMARRLGWATLRDGDASLITDLFSLLAVTETDYVIFLRNLASVSVADALTGSADSVVPVLADAYYVSDSVPVDALVGWLRRWAERVAAGGVVDDTQRRVVMEALNPRFVLRNWIAQTAIDAATDGDLSVLREVHDVLRHPYDEQPSASRWAARRPDWARTKVGCSMLSCSS